MAKNELRLDLPDEAATNRLGEDIAAVLAKGDAVALKGELGAGKTMLARALIRALAGDPALDVPSPSFTLVQAYEGRLPVLHLDLYRLGSPDELEELGLDEGLENGAVLIEWPERAGELLPEQAITVEIETAGFGRSVNISGDDEALARIRRSLDIRDFLQRSGLGDAHRRYLLGDASVRAYETVTCGAQPPLILMNAPRRSLGPVIRDGKTYGEIAHLAHTVVPFVAMDRALRERGFAAPEIQAQDLEKGLLLLENLGDIGIIRQDGSPIKERYLASAELLAAIHAYGWPAELPVMDGLTHRLPPYDRDAMLIEVELFLDWFMPFASGRNASDKERAEFHSIWDDLITRLGLSKPGIVLRDFHSPNIIWRADREGHDRLGIIDFQDALVGPSAYDVASLAFDARIDIPPDLSCEIVEAYRRARGISSAAERERFDEAFAIAAAQRNTKILGLFVRLDRRDGKPHYLRHLPRIRDYVMRALDHPAMGPLRDFYFRAKLAEAAL
jgi:tRNA threonylcarbamoyl adenosine modification protein YjeE